MPPKTRKNRSGLPSTKTILPPNPSDDRPSSHDSTHHDTIRSHSTNSFAIFSEDKSITNDDESHQVKDPPSFPHANARSQPSTTTDPHDSNKPSSTSSYASIDNYMTSYASVAKRNLDPKMHSPTDPSSNQSPDHNHSLDDRFRSVLGMIEMQQTQLSNADKANTLRYNHLDTTTSFITTQLDQQKQSTQMILKQLDSQNSVLNNLISSSMNQSHKIAPSSNQSCDDTKLTTKVEAVDAHQSVIPTNDSLFGSCDHKPSNGSHPHSDTHSVGHEPTHKVPHLPTTSTNIFGSNEFALACSGKIKFSEIESSLKTKKLNNDTDIQME
jgi:hypothetical protein